ncbi:MAG: T9SS type A sorting domain-containing protein [Bacteroidales bacterium]|nr:T9SS type A sorting domain-containing protein [Bacteroidales bacterium]
MGEEEVYSLDIAGIHDTFELNFLNYEVDCGASIEETTSENNFSIMPNPATNYFNIEGENIAKVEVYNAIGQMIDVVNVENDNVQVSTENYNNGVYFVKATTTNGQVSVQKVVVSK